MFGVFVNVATVLIGSTIKSYLSYLYHEGKIGFEFMENKMYWKQRS